VSHISSGGGGLSLDAPSCKNDCHFILDCITQIPSIKFQSQHMSASFYEQNFSIHLIFV
jgi:hypothetical protein